MCVFARLGFVNISASHFRLSTGLTFLTGRAERVSGLRLVSLLLPCRSQVPALAQSNWDIAHDLVETESVLRDLMSWLLLVHLARIAQNATVVTESDVTSA